MIKALHQALCLWMVNRHLEVPDLQQSTHILHELGDEGSALVKMSPGMPTQLKRSTSSRAMFWKVTFCSRIASGYWVAYQTAIRSNSIPMIGNGTSCTNARMCCEVHWHFLHCWQNHCTSATILQFACQSEPCFFKETFNLTWPYFDFCLSLLMLILLFWYFDSINSDSGLCSGFGCQWLFFLLWIYALSKYALCISILTLHLWVLGYRRLWLHPWSSKLQ